MDCAAGPAVTNTLRAELEALLDLDELRTLARDWLGFEAPMVTARATFADALLRHAAETHAIEALCDAVTAHCGAVNGSVAKIRSHGFCAADELAPGSALGRYRLTEVLGRGPSATVFAATDGLVRLRIKVLTRRAAQARSSATRYLALARASGQKLAEGLPELQFAGDVEGRTVLVHLLADGRPLAGANVLQKPRKLREMWPDLRRILECLAALHSRRLVHGSIRAENVLYAEDAGRRVSLLDAGAHFLRTPADATSPEQVRGELPTARSDLYAFGLLLYEFLSGKPPFEGTPADLAESMLSRQPSPLSFVAPPGLVPPELDELMLDLLDRRPSARPADAESVMDVLGAIATRTGRTKSNYPEAELELLAQRLLERPQDALVAGLLEAAVDAGADPGAVANALLAAADQVKTQPEARRLVSRAAAILETNDDLAATERAYRRLLAIDGEDEAAWTGLERLHRDRGAYDRVVDLLVERTERLTNPTERARVLLRMAHVLDSKLDDSHQALIAVTHAFCDDPSSGAVRDEIERLAGTNTARWSEVLAVAAEAVTHEQVPEKRHALLLQMSHWYGARAGQPALAKRCLEAILLADPGHDAALAELSSFHRRMRNWKEHAETLVLRASAAVAPSLARDLRLEAANVLERELSNRKGAVTLYEQIVGEDPGNTEANEALCRGYEEEGARAKLIGALERWIPLAEPSLVASLKLRLGRLLEDSGDPARALDVLESAFQNDPTRVEALVAIERIAAALGRHDLEQRALERQLQFATSPRQRITLLERLARLFVVEQLDQKSAAVVLERILEIEPEHLGALAELAPIYEKLARWDDLARTIDRQVRALPRGKARAEQLSMLGSVLETRLGKLNEATAAYEAALDIVPNFEAALDGVARISTSLGDSPRATAALDTLANESESPERRAKNFVRAAELLEKQGDFEGAINRYRNAMEAMPESLEAGRRLRALYLARGDVSTVITLLERGMANGGSDIQKAELGLELARLLSERRRDLGGAEAVALRVIAMDPTRAEAHALIGEAARSSGRFEEAVKHFAAAARHAAQLSPSDTVKLLAAYSDSLASAGDPAQALSMATQLVERFPADQSAWECAADLAFRHGPPERSVELHQELATRFPDSSESKDSSRLTQRLGESLLRAGRTDEAIAALERAAELDPNATAPLSALLAVYEAKRDVPAIVRTLHRHLERARGDERVDLLVQIGDIASTSMGDHSVAEESYLKALSIRPSDRRILLKLVELYTKGRDWNRLVETVIKLADVAPDGEQRAKRILVAARVMLEELGNTSRAVGLVNQALSIASGSSDVALEAMALLSTAGDTEGLRQLLEVQIQAAARMADKGKALDLGKRLADLHLSELHADEAISVYEAILRINGPTPELEETLSDLYASDPTRYMERAQELQARIIARDAYRAEPYRSLLRLHADAKQRDGAFCACQALVAIERASSEEERYFSKHRSTGDIPTGSRLTEEDLRKLVFHPRVDPLITAIFSRIQVAILATRGKPLDKLGYGPEAIVDPTHASGMVQAVLRVSDLLGMRAPVMVRSRKQQAAIGLVHSDLRCLSLSEAALGSRVPRREATFVAAAHLTYCLPGFIVRGMVPTVLGLKAWLTAAIRCFAPRLAVPPELEGPSMEAARALEKHVTGTARDWLAEPVNDLLHRSAAADVATWVAGIDRTSDRLGLIACGDLPTALSAIRAARDSSTAVPIAERARELLAYSVSAEYLVLRQRLRMDLEHQEDAPSGADNDIEALSETEFQELS